MMLMLMMLMMVDWWTKVVWEQFLLLKLLWSLVLSLVHFSCDKVMRQRVHHCHWKSGTKLPHSVVDQPLHLTIVAENVELN